MQPFYDSIYGDIYTTGISPLSNPDLDQSAGGPLRLALPCALALPIQPRAPPPLLTSSRRKPNPQLLRLVTPLLRLFLPLTVLK
jgi:hypothetical protein